MYRLPMNILVIKTTSLGDVLHATPHLRAIRQQYPDAHLTVLTARASAEIYANNPAVDRLILFDHARFKQLGIGSPRALTALIRRTQAEINDREYDLAFDFQGLLRSVIFLYLTRARKKFVKGQWPCRGGYGDKRLHAIDEMTQVLAEAGIPVADTTLEFARAPEVIDQLLAKMAKQGLNGLIEQSRGRQFVIISPFTRWSSKNWPLERFIQTASSLSQTHTVLITGTAKDRNAIKACLVRDPAINNVFNLAGEFNLAELAELMSRAALVISGDSFPMHLATAVGAPLIAIYGPTDERKTGPRSADAVVIRPDICQRCDEPDCSSACLGQIPVSKVESVAREMLS